MGNILTRTQKNYKRKNNRIAISQSDFIIFLVLPILITYAHNAASADLVVAVHVATVKVHVDRAVSLVL